MNLTEYSDPASIRLDLQAGDKEQVIRGLVDLLARRGVIQDREALVTTLMEREGLGSTGIGHGVAIPHGRTRELSAPALAFGRTSEAVDFDAIDGQPTRLFFLLVAPENGGSEYLHLLARIARLMKDAPTREQLLEAGSAEEVLALLGRNGEG